MSRQINAEGLKLIKDFETGKDQDTGKLLPLGEPALKAYLCPAGVWTIGWGHTGSDVRKGLTITREQAEALLGINLLQFETDVESLVKVPLNDNQFSALVSFAYNVGPDIDEDTIAEGLGDSTLLKKLNAGDYQGAADEFPKWNKAKGKVLKGLGLRRLAERNLFLKEITV